jgi:hypothetical protein
LARFRAQEESMSIFGKIMSGIFGHSTAAAPAGAPKGGSAAAAGGDATPADIAAEGAQTNATGSAKPSAIPSSTPAPPQSVDVAAVVDKAAADKGETLEWRTSIVDLMKALDIDSGLATRKELAKELGYTGDANDSASMNVWLHKQIMAKLAANGGKLPPEIML